MRRAREGRGRMTGKGFACRTKLHTRLDHADRHTAYRMLHFLHAVASAL